MAYGRAAGRRSHVGRGVVSSCPRVVCRRGVFDARGRASEIRFRDRCLRGLQGRCRSVRGSNDGHSLLYARFAPPAPHAAAGAQRAAFCYIRDSITQALNPPVLPTCPVRSGRHDSVVVSCRSGRDSEWRGGHRTADGTRPRGARQHDIPYRGGESREERRISRLALLYRST